MDDVHTRLTRLEERFTHLQQHVTEQDRVILHLTEELERTRRELARLTLERDESGSGAADLPAHERPPHY